MPPVSWLMVPAGTVEETLASLAPLLQAGDMIIDGGNSNYKDTQPRAAGLAAQQPVMIDVGASGGVWGLGSGYSMMVGGDATVNERLRPILAALAPTSKILRC